jgi:hypothetical protein
LIRVTRDFTRVDCIDGSGVGHLELKTAGRHPQEYKTKLDA